MSTDALDLSHTLHTEETTPLTLQEIQAKRMLATNDRRGVAYTFGNRATRRMVGRSRGTGGKPKQYHKTGH